MWEPTHLLCFRKIPLLFYTKECFENQTGLYTLALLHTSHELHNNNNDFYDMLLEIYVYLQTSDEMKYVHLGLSMSLDLLRVLHVTVLVLLLRMECKERKVI